MATIIKSFLLSFGLVWQMILPVIGIFFASGIVFGFLGMVLGELTQLISPAITGMFITLFGIRGALFLLGERSRTDFQFLTLYALAFSAILFLAKAVAALLAYGRRENTS